MEEMSNVNRSALSLSRARLDHILFDNAARSGAICLEAMAVKRFLFDNGAPCGVEAMSLDDGKTVEFKARLIVDASGRNSRLTLSRRERTVGKRGARLYALKSHLRAVEGIEDQVELYFFPEGYGGLSRIEDGLVNLCFIVTERALTDAGGDPANTLQRTFMNHPTARERLAQARVEGRWMSAGPLAFGTRRLAQDGALIIGDASGMIDPFTGTGIQIALRAGELAAQSIIEAFQSSNGDLFDSALMSYRALYDQEFGRRMKMAGLLRRAALSPRPANLLARLLARAPRIARKILRSTRA
jgi:flavin-dependent dehydrogenase